MERWNARLQGHTITFSLLRTREDRRSKRADVGWECFEASGGSAHRQRGRHTSKPLNGRGMVCLGHDAWRRVGAPIC